MAAPLQTGTTPTRRINARSLTIDLLKTAAAQVIMLHHFAIYGPMSDHVRPLVSGAVDFVASHGSLAVHVFLAVSGFLAAHSLATAGKATVQAPWSLIGRRAVRLLPAYWLTIALAVGAAALASHWAVLDHTPETPSLLILLANAMTLQDVLDLPALSAGFWYVAIDLQLFVLTVLLFRALSQGTQARRTLQWVAAATGLSLFIFNRMPDWQVWAPYFMGSFGMGMMAGLIAQEPDNTLRRWGMVALCLLPAIALLIEWRSRVVVAGLTSLVLAAQNLKTRQSSAPAGLRRLAAWLGDRSYALFLEHYPICLVADAAAVRFLSPDPVSQGLALCATWVVSMLASDLLHRQVERRFTRSVAAR